MLGLSSPEWARYLHDELAVPLDPHEINREVVRRMQELSREQLRRCSPERSTLSVRCDSVGRWGLPPPPPPPQTATSRSCSWSWASSPARSLPPSPQKRRPGASRRPTCISPQPKRWRRPAKSAAVEDSSNGLRAATATGMTVIAVPNPHYPPTHDALQLAAATVDAIADVTRAGRTASRADTSPGSDNAARLLSLPPSRTRTSALAGIATLLRRHCGDDGTVAGILTRGAVGAGPC